MWTLMMSPLAKGLFHAAVDMSGSYVYNATLKQAESDNLVFLEKTGCRDLTCLRRLSVKQVLQVGNARRLRFLCKTLREFCCKIPTKGSFLSKQRGSSVIEEKWKTEKNTIQKLFPFNI